MLEGEDLERLGVVHAVHIPVPDAAERRREVEQRVLRAGSEFGFGFGFGFEFEFGFGFGFEFGFPYPQSASGSGLGYRIPKRKSDLQLGWELPGF
jgi:hypothetical protein